jgi:hypothetical protein
MRLHMSAPWVRFLLLLCLVGVCLFVFCQEADAGIGGQFVKKSLSTKFGRIGGIIVGGLTLLAAIILLPLILYVKIREWSGIRKTKQDLAALAAKFSWFEWLSIRDRIKKAVKEIGKVWASGDLSSVAKFMTPEYFTSQQELLNRWKDEGKDITYRVEKIRKIEPLALRVEDEETYSWIRALVVIDCVDYMRDGITKEVVKGEVGKTSGFESVWCFVYRNGEWLLNGIEEGTTSMAWASSKNHVDTSYLEYARAKQRQKQRDAEEVPTRVRPSQTAARNPAANPPATQKEQRLIRKPAEDEEG